MSPWLITTTGWPWTVSLAVHGWVAVLHRPVLVVAALVLVAAATGLAAGLAVRPGRRLRLRSEPSRRSTS